MKGEINRDWYCAAGECDEGHCQLYPQSIQDVVLCSSHPKCRYRHRKHPTLEQFLEEYGEEWKGATYFFNENNCGQPIWVLCSDPEIDTHRNLQVCACTPWGKPPNDWRLI
jgi:hypothetical protein